MYSQLQEDKVFLAGHKHIYQLQDVRVLHPSNSERSQYQSRGVGEWGWGREPKRSSGSYRVVLTD